MVGNIHKWLGNVYGIAAVNRSPVVTGGELGKVLLLCVLQQPEM